MVHMYLIYLFNNCLCHTQDTPFRVEVVLFLCKGYTPGQNGPGSNGNEGELPTPHQISRTGASPSDAV